MKSKQDNNRFDDLLRQKMQGLEVTPPPYRLPSSSSASPVLIPILRGIGVAILVLIPFLPLNKFTNPHSLQGFFASEKPNDKAESTESAVYEPILKLADQEIAISAPSMVKKEPPATNTQKELSPTARKAKGQKAMLQLDQLDQRIKEEYSPASIQQNQWRDISGIPPYIALTASSLFPKAITMEKHGLKGNEKAAASAAQATETSAIQIAFIGMHNLHGFSWIINQNTYGLYESKIANSSSGVSSRYGTHIGIRLKDDINLIVGANYLAKHNHSYFMRIRNSVVNQEVKLLYHQVPVIIQKEQKRLFQGNDKMTGHWEVGMQYARLLAARIGFGTSDASAYTRFRKHEISVLAGYSLEYHLSPRWSLTAGIRGRVGTGINSDNWLIQDKNYRQSHNANISTTFGLRYWLHE